MPCRILEISSKRNKAGKAPIKIALLKIHEDANETNINGIHWKEENILKNIESVKSIPIACEFIDDEKEIPLGHGLTGSHIDENGFEQPEFLNSEVVGIIEDASIDIVNIDGIDTKVLLGNGYLYSHRYPKFVNWVRKNVNTNKVDTSIEISGLEENSYKIKYEEDKPTDDFRTPSEFVFSGCAIISVKPSDSNAIVVEISEMKNKENNEIMNEKDKAELLEGFKAIVSELNSAKAESDGKIAELNSVIEKKDAKIAELNATIEQVQKALNDLKAEHDTYWAERDLLEKELTELKIAKRLSELNEAIADYSEDEVKVAEVEINSFREKPMEGNVDAIVNKICRGIVKKQKDDAKTVEINSKVESYSDIYGDIDSVDEDKDCSIF